MPITTCPGCASPIEFGSDYIGQRYTCENCGREMVLNLRVIPPPKTITVDTTRIPIPVERIRQPQGPSISTAWGWTWRILLCLFLAGILISIIGSIIAFSLNN